VNVVFAKDTAELPIASGPVFVRKGSHWPADDAVVKAYPGWFTDDPRYGLSWSGQPPAEMAEPPVETATAAPGEKRSTARRG
jgi:hypothetical protein